MELAVKELCSRLEEGWACKSQIGSTSPCSNVSVTADECNGRKMAENHYEENDLAVFFFFE